jgi:tetratricopeptide (TPR) repeat protein
MGVRYLRHGARGCVRNPACRAQYLDAQLARLDELIVPLVTARAPGLLRLFGVGPDTAAMLLVAAGDHPGRLRSEAAWAHLCAVAPIPATSGRTKNRHRVLASCDQASRAHFTARETFFVSSAGNQITSATVGKVFARIWDQAGLARPAGGQQPRPYDFRHHFQLDAQTADDAAQRIAHLRRLAEEQPDIPPSVFGMLAFAAANSNEPTDTVARLALRALDGAPKLLPEAVDRPPFFYHACIALTFAERFEEALRRFDDALADARRLGSLPHVLSLSCYRALVHLRVGNLADAEADARAALETSPRLPGMHAAVALAALLETLAERGELKAAEAADQRYRLAEQFPTTLHAGSVLAARGRLRLAELRPAEALGDLLAAG